MKPPAQHNSIRTWALVAVAVTTAAIIYFAHWLIEQLASADWCNRMLGASEFADGRPEYAIRACSALLLQQVKALAWNSHLLIGVLAFSLLVLVVIVLAGGKLSFSASAKGVSGNMGRELDAKEAAEFVADEAQAAADAVPETAPAKKPAVDEPEGGA